MERGKILSKKIKAELVYPCCVEGIQSCLAVNTGVTLADINLWRDQFIEVGLTGLSVNPTIQKTECCRA